MTMKVVEIMLRTSSELLLSLGSLERVGLGWLTVISTLCKPKLKKLRIEIHRKIK